WLPQIPEPKSSLLQHHALVAGQLRYCARMYHSSLLKNEIFRAETAGVGSNYNIEFEPLSSGLPYDFRRTILGLHSDHWEQRCPWRTRTGCTSPNDLRLTEILSTLGTIQSCPAETGKLPKDPGDSDEGIPDDPFRPSNGVCRKPLPENDLQPDFVGLLGYFRNSDANDVAVESPGLWAIRNPGIDLNSRRPFETTGVYKNSVNDHLPILLVTHLAPSTDQISAINDIVKNSLSNRPITIVYIPVSGSISEIDANVATLMSTFDVPSPPTDEETENALYVFAPTTDFDTSCDASDPSAYDEATCFERYWRDLLDGSSTDEYNIFSAAKTIFNKRILKVELSL
ncbi:MAG: hypothetical protein KDD42_07435, partial [Bdellovibrionales bacterium]|nr:hypothetical protein [Bdellovibrionales bacterium]